MEHAASAMRYIRSSARSARPGLRSPPATERSAAALRPALAFHPRVLLSVTGPTSSSFEMLPGWVLSPLAARPMHLQKLGKPAASAVRAMVSARPPPRCPAHTAGAWCRGIVFVMDWNTNGGASSQQLGTCSAPAAQNTAAAQASRFMPTPQPAEGRRLAFSAFAGLSTSTRDGSGRTFDLITALADAAAR